jgi:8-oxo-dGTP pyrophosphatase MutT (NUDIX family)
MEFHRFLEYVPNITKLQLDAQASHAKMSPVERMDLVRKLNPDHQNPQKAAVMVLIYPKNDQAHLVLIVRPSYPGIHSSQVSFPGGRAEATDTSFLHTALRECEEEVGVASQKVNFIKQMQSVYIPPSNFLMHPFLGFSTETLSFTPQASEVQRILEVPLRFFLEEASLTNQKMNTSYGVQIVVPGWNFEQHFIWGATAMVLSELKDHFDLFR